MKKKEYCSLGIMSGTSMDGLDFSLIRTDGKSNISNLINQYYKFNQNFKESIKKLIKNINDSNCKLIINSNEFINFNKIFTEHIYKLIKKFLSKHSIRIELLDVIGIHGNTIIHKPDQGFSIQLGDAKVLSKKMNKLVISNFRDNDIKEKGQGAPLVPIFHQNLFSEKNKKIMVVNLGGISNFTFLVGKNKVLASDIGPGNKLIDEYCNLNFKVSYDANGEISSRGKVINELIKKWARKSFVSQSFPVSFDNAFFRLQDFIDKNSISKFDLLRTLTYFTAYLMFNLKKKMKSNIDKWIFCGGGVHNKILMQDIKNLLGKEIVFTTKDFNFDPFFIESQAFAYISVRTLKNLPSTFPKTTGCLRSSLSGVVYNPN